RADDAKANVISGNNTGKFQTKKFYLEYRLCVAYAKSDPNSPNPNFKSLAEWKNIKSTKMDVCAKICAYYLNRDDVPDVTFTDGKLIFPKISKLDPALSHLKTRKILIYSEFPSMTALLRKVLRLYNGTESLAIDGTMSFDKRTETVAEFYKPDSARVLIFSSVGSAGLNLSIADVVIFFRKLYADRINRGHPKTRFRFGESASTTTEKRTRGKKDMYDAFVHKILPKVQRTEKRFKTPSMRQRNLRNVNESQGKGKEKAPEETAQAPEKENEDGEMDIVQNSLLENQSQPDPQAFESAPTTDVDGMDIAEDPHAFQSTDAEGMGVTEEEGELGFPTDEASLSGVGDRSSDDELLRPPPSKGSRKTTRAGNSRMVAQEKSVDTLERKSDNGTSHTPDSPQSAKSPPPKRRKTDSQTADSQTKPKVGPLVNLKKTAKPKSSRSDKPKSSRSDKPQPGWKVKVSKTKRMYSSTTFHNSIRAEAKGW
ncbi:hypothetical protein BDP27DRAFT_1370864, partial [Rhodocollybia butyracea]